MCIAFVPGCCFNVNDKDAHHQLNKTNMKAVYLTAPLEPRKGAPRFSFCHSINCTWPLDSARLVSSRKGARPSPTAPAGAAAAVVAAENFMLLMAIIKMTMMTAAVMNMMMKGRMIVWALMSVRGYCVAWNIVMFTSFDYPPKTRRERHMHNCRSK